MELAKVEKCFGQPGGSRALQLPPAAVTYAGYDAAADEKEYCRSLLTESELAQAKADPFLTHQEVTNIINANMTKTYNTEGIFVIDPSLVVQIDQRVNHCIFILPDNRVHDREALLELYPFDEFQTSPEEVFAQQVVGVFPAPKSHIDKTTKTYMMRDIGSKEEFVMLEDLVGRHARKNYKKRRPPEQVVKTKIFLARQGWDDFETMSKHVRALRNVLGNALRKSKAAGQPGMLETLLRPGTGGLCIEDSAAIQNRLDKAEETVRRLEKDAARRDAEYEALASKLAAMFDA
jgi:hypothetical protein